MKEVRTGGGREFIYSVLWAIVILFTGRALILFMPSYKLFGGIITLILFSVLGFFVLTRYAAVFTYTLKGYRLRINRQIGKRNKELEIKLTDIQSISDEKPGTMPRKNMIYNMRASVFSKQKLCYIKWRCGEGDMVLVFEPSAAMKNEIQKLMRSDENG